MSQLKSRIGQWTIQWKSPPRGLEGTSQCEIKPGVVVDVRWRRDSDGIWIQLPYGIFGFDLQGELDDNGQSTYRVSQRGSHLEWYGVSVSLGDENAQALSQGGKPKPTRIRAQMPGKIIRLMVEVGQVVQKDQPILVMEAMKMENEIRASQAGQVSQLKVVEGQAVETGADLAFLEPIGK
jgi:biotin carboxyl carrier protein